MWPKLYSCPGSAGSAWAQNKRDAADAALFHKEERRQNDATPQDRTALALSCAWTPAHFFRVSSTLPWLLVVANVFSSSLSMVRSTGVSLSPILKVRTILVPSIL